MLLPTNPPPLPPGRHTCSPAFLITHPYLIFSVPHFSVYTFHRLERLFLRAGLLIPLVVDSSTLILFFTVYVYSSYALLNREKRKFCFFLSLIRFPPTSDFFFLFFHYCVQWEEKKKGKTNLCSTHIDMPAGKIAPLKVPPGLYGKYGKGKNNFHNETIFLA